MSYLSFALIIGLGASLGLAWAAYRTGLQEASKTLNAGLVVLLGAYVGSRLVYLLLNQTYFQHNPNELLNLPVGGFAWSGALAGGGGALLVFTWRTKYSSRELADALVPLLVTLSIGTWLGCWWAGCAYGGLTESWWGIQAVDEWGTLAQRWPVQPVGALLSLGVLWVIDQIPTNRLPAGGAAASSVFGLCLVILLMSLIRRDPGPYWNNLRLDTWIALIYSGAAGFSLLVLFAAARRDNSI